MQQQQRQQGEYIELKDLEEDGSTKPATRGRGIA